MNQLIQSWIIVNLTKHFESGIARCCVSQPQRFSVPWSGCDCQQRHGFHCSLACHCAGNTGGLVLRVPCWCANCEAISCLCRAWWPTRNASGAQSMANVYTMRMGDAFSTDSIVINSLVHYDSILLVFDRILLFFGWHASSLDEFGKPQSVLTVEHKQL